MAKITSTVDGSICRRFKPHLLMALAQLGYTLLFPITEASFNHGMNPHIYVTYRHAVAGAITFPFAYFLERKTRPKLTWSLLLEFFVLSLLGVSLTPNMYFASLRYTSTTLVASMVNTVASLTFVIAVVLRLEVVDLRRPRGIAKVLGTVISLAGVMTMTLYKGPAMKNLWKPLIHMPKVSTYTDEHWIKGSVLSIASCITWSLLYIMQAVTLKRYPAQLSLIVWMNFIGSAQSAVFTALLEHKAAVWSIGFNIDFISTIYGAVVVACVIVFIQLWCTGKKGPVFVTMFSPLSTVLVAVFSYLVLGEKLHLGSIVGAAVVISGLYLLLWGKEGDQEADINPDQKLHVTEEAPESRAQVVA